MSDYRAIVEEMRELGWTYTAAQFGIGPWTVAFIKDGRSCRAEDAVLDVAVKRAAQLAQES